MQRRIMWHPNFEYSYPLSGLQILMHGAISLSDATSYDNLGYNLLVRNAGTGDNYKYRAESFSDLWSTFFSHLAETFDIPKMSVGMHCAVHFTSYASQVSPPITHNQGVYDLDNFISGGIFGVARPSIFLNALSPPLKLCCPFFHCVISRRHLSKGFHDVLMNFFGRYSFLTEVLDNCSEFKFV